MLYNILHCIWQMLNLVDLYIYIIIFIEILGKRFIKINIYI